MSQNQKIFTLSDTVTLTSKTVAQFRQTLNDPAALSQFLRNAEKAVAFLSALAEGNEHWQNCLVETFCKPDTIFDLANSGKIDEIWRLLLKLSTSERQITVLCAPEVVYILSKNGKADAVRELIANFPKPAQRLSVCTVPYAVFGMTKYGRAGKMLALIQDFSGRQQAAVLSASHAIYGLIENLEEADKQALLDRIQHFSKDQQAAILASDLAVFGLVKHGEINRVLSLLRTFSSTQQQRVRNAAYVIPVLTENATPEALEFFITGLPKKRDERSRKELMSIYRSSQRHLH